MISKCLGVYERDSIVQYIANGLPVYSHLSEDLQNFRFITSRFINQGLCKSSEVPSCFGIPVDSVKRHLTKLRTEGEAAFFPVRNEKVIAIRYGVLFYKYPYKSEDLPI